MMDGWEAGRMHGWIADGMGEILAWILEQKNERGKK